MNLRISAPLFVLASLVSACGPRTQSDASFSSTVAPQGFALASMGATPVRRTSTRERVLKKETGTLTARFDVAQHPTDVQFDFHVVNASGKRLEITYPSGQAYDFVVIDSVGREVWRWADGRVFTQSVQNKLLGKGESLTINEKWSPARKGKYTAIASLRSINFPVEERVDFERK